MAQVRYFVTDVEEAADFYTAFLGFKLERRNGAVMALVSHGDLQLWLAGPTASASRPLLDGARPAPARVGGRRNPEDVVIGQEHVASWVGDHG